MHLSPGRVSSSLVSPFPFFGSPCLSFPSVLPLVTPRIIFLSLLFPFPFPYIQTRKRTKKTHRLGLLGSFFSFVFLLAFSGAAGFTFFSSLVLTFGIAVDGDEDHDEARRRSWIEVNGVRGVRARAAEGDRFFGGEEEWVQLSLGGEDDDSDVYLR